jgi:hypothetical protein
MTTKMKTSLIFCLFCCTSCLIKNQQKPVYREEFDVYKQKPQKSVEFRLNSEEKWSPINNASFYILNTGETPKIYVVLNKGITAFYPEKIAYFKIDNDIFKLPFLNIENEKFITNSESTKNVLLADSTRTNVIESVSTNENFQIKFELHLDEKMRQKILDAKTVSVRIYSGGKTNTFTFDDIVKIKNVL